MTHHKGFYNLRHQNSTKSLQDPGFSREGGNLRKYESKDGWTHRWKEGRKGGTY